MALDGYEWLWVVMRWYRLVLGGHECLWVVMGGIGVVMVGFGSLRVVAKCCKASIIIYIIVIKESPSSAQVAQIGEKNFKKRNEENQFFL